VLRRSKAFGVLLEDAWERNLRSLLGALLLRTSAYVLEVGQDVWKTEGPEVLWLQALSNI
jgi:hypothetical protein